MGEYITLDGQSMKLGTCEDLYYVTYEQLARIAPRAQYLPGNAKPMEYLEAGFRYRFPFPDEDALVDSDDYERQAVFRTFTDDAKAIVEGIDHETISGAHIHPRGVFVPRTTQSLTSACITLPCPQGKEWKGHPYHSRLVSIQQQKSTKEGEFPQLWLVIGCPFCSAKVRVGPGEAKVLTDEMLRFAPDPFWKKIAERIQAGYMPDNPFARFMAEKEASKAA